MGKIEFNIPTRKKKLIEENEDLYERLLTMNTSEDDIIEDCDDSDEEENEFSDCSEIDAVDLGPKLTKRLREEIRKPEYNRDYLQFRYRGETFEGIPIHEINPGKFIFNIDGKLKGVNLKEAVIL